MVLGLPGAAACLRGGALRSGFPTPFRASAPFPHSGDSHPNPSFAARAATLLVALALPPCAGAQQLQIHHIDVDQGDATLLVMPNGRSRLVDSGPDSRGDEVASFLRGQGVSRWDAFLLTHFDADHMDGIDRVVADGIGAREGLGGQGHAAKRERRGGVTSRGRPGCWRRFAAKLGTFGQNRNSAPARTKTWLARPLSE